MKSMPCFAALAFAMAGHAFATAPVTPAATAPSIDPTDKAAGIEAPAMRAGFDRSTGRFRALTSEELEALREKVAEQRGNGFGLLRRAGLSQPETDAEAQAQAVQLADGSVITPVPMELMVSLEASRAEDGRLVVTHGDARLDHAHPATAKGGHDHE